ncbi:MAG: hypothetical protein ACREXJ_08350, partial [Gammaproteobacteria bacterium]
MPDGGTSPPGGSGGAGPPPRPAFPARLGAGSGERSGLESRPAPERWSVISMPESLEFDFDNIERQP